MTRLSQEERRRVAAMVERVRHLQTRIKVTRLDQARARLRRRIPPRPAQGPSEGRMYD